MKKVDDKKVFNDLKDAFKEGYEHICGISDYLSSMIGYKPIGSSTFKRLKFLANLPTEISESDYKFYKTVYNIISPMEAQITNFANDHLFFLELPKNQRVKNISTLNTSLLPAIQKLKLSLQTYITPKLLNAGVKKVVKKPVVVKQAKQAIKKVYTVKPNDKLITPIKQTASLLNQAAVMYNNVLVKPDFTKTNPLIESMKQYRKIAVLKQSDNNKISNRASELISVLESYDSSSETIVDSIDNLHKTIKQAQALSNSIKKQNNLSPEAVLYAKINNINVVCNAKK